jgi:hypothetical protein
MQLYIQDINAIDSLFPRALRALLMLLNYNIANFETPVDESSVFDVATREKILELFLNLLKDDRFSFLHGFVYFIMVDSFAVLFADPTEKMSVAFVTLYKEISRNSPLFAYLVEQVRYSKELPYLLPIGAFRDFFHPVISSLVQGVATGSLADEFLDCYLRSLMIELRATYTEYPRELPSRPHELSNTFMSLSSMISKHALDFFTGLADVHAADLETHPFLQFYRKWLTMLQPFTGLSRMWPAAVYLQPVFTHMAKRVLGDWKLPLLPSSGKMHFIAPLFFETFSLYTDFMTSILDDGQEMKDTARYHWLITPIRSSCLEPSNLDDLEKKLDPEDPNKLQPASSSTMAPTATDSVSDIELFVWRIGQTAETEESEWLRKFVCDRNRNVRSLDAAQKRVERIFLSALVKQLSVSGELYDIYLHLPQTGIVVPPRIESIRTAVLTVRPKLQFSRQRTAERSPDEHTGGPRTLEEDYPAYCRAIIQKCVFLLHVPPCLPEQGGDFAAAFQKALGQLKDFVVAPLTFFELYTRIEAADCARAQVATEMALVNEVFTFNQPLIISHVVNKLASSTFLIDFLSTLNLCAEVPLGQITTFLSNVTELVGSESIHISRNSVVVLASTLVLAFAKIDPVRAETAFIDITTEIVRQQEAIGNIYRSFTAYLSTVLVALCQENEQFVDSKLPERFAALFPESGPTARDLACLRIALSPERKVFLTLDAFRGPPSNYHEAAKWFFGALSKEISLDFVSGLLFNLSNALAGHDSIFMADAPLVGPGIASVCRTPTAILAGCAETIQIFRQLLLDECPTKQRIVEIFIHILRRFSGAVSSYSSSSEFVVFNDPILLFGIFAILSNSIDVERPNSLLRDIHTNAVYYVSCTNFASQEFTVWRLPIVTHSVQITLPFSPNLIPVSRVPFREAMFPATDLLLPYFLSILRDRPLASIPSSLTFLVAASMREYFSNSGFLTTIFDRVAPRPSTITYTDSHWVFTAELRTKLLWRGISRFPFHAFSPSEIDPLGIVTASTLTSTHTRSFFISELLSSSGEVSLKFSPDPEVTVFVYLFSPIGDDNWFLLPLENPEHLFVWRPEDGSVVSATKIKLEGLEHAPVFFLVAVQGGTTKYTLKMSEPLQLSGQLVLGKRAGQKQVVTRPTDGPPSLSVQSGEQVVIGISPPKPPTEPLLQFDPDFLKHLSSGCQASCPAREVPPPLIIRPYTVPLAGHSVVNCALFVNPLLGVVNYSDSSTPPHIDPLSGTVGKLPGAFTMISALPTLSFANYTTLPSPVASLLSQKFAKLRRAEVQNLFFLHCLATPAIPIAQTLSRFGVDLPGLVHHIQRLLVAIEPLDHIALTTRECPIDFDRNMLTEPPTTAFGLMHEALVAVFAHIGTADIATEFADAWMSGILAMAGHHGYHTCCQENPDAFFRYASPSGLVMLCRHPRPVVVVRAGLHGEQAAPPIEFLVMSEDSCGTGLLKGSKDPTAIFAFIAASSNAALVGTFYEFVISLKYFVLFIAKYELMKKAEYRKHVYLTVIRAFILKSPFFAMFPRQILHFIEYLLPLESTDLRGELVQMLNPLAAYCRQVRVINTFLLGLQDLYDEFAFIGLKSYFPSFLTQAYRSVLNTLSEKSFKLPSKQFVFPLVEAVGPNVGRKILRLLAPRESVVGLPFHLFIYEWIYFAQHAPPYESHFNKKVLHLDFTFIVPRSVQLSIKRNSQVAPMKRSIRVVGKSVDIYLDKGKSWDSVEYTIIGDWAEPDESFLRRYATIFNDDMLTYLHMGNTALDLEILHELSLNIITAPQIDISSITPENFRACTFRQVPRHIFLLRACHIAVLNWCIFHSFISFADLGTNDFDRLISPKLRVAEVRNLVADNSTQGKIPRLAVHRAKALEVREGRSSSFDNSLVRQLIFEIDYKYPQLITSLEKALDREMSEDEFGQTFPLTFVVSDINGQQIPLCERGWSETLTLGKCRRFITLANEFRLAQLKEALQPIYDGLWLNFNFKPPPRLPGIVLEFCACGERLIDGQLLRSLTEIDIPPAQEALFWRVVEEFSQEERGPPGFRQMQNYSSFENALTYIRMAITGAGTFDKSGSERPAFLLTFEGIWIAF